MPAAAAAAAVVVDVCARNKHVNTATGTQRVR